MSFIQGSAAPTKRDKPHDYDDPTARPKPRVSAPFLDDSDDGSEAEEEATYGGPPAKRRMLQPTPTYGPVLDNAGPEEQPPKAAGDENATDAAVQQLEQSTATQDVLPSWSSQRPLFSRSLFGSLTPSTFSVQTCDGTSITIKQRKTSAAPSYESMVASRSKTKEGRAKRSYYGIDIHELMSTASKEIANKKTEPAGSSALTSIEASPAAPGSKPKKTLLWTEKYRARTFMDLCGDDGTNRLVLRWLKKWDPLVFPGAAKSKPVIVRRPGAARPQGEEEKPHRKILMLTGPPGLGKTTLAHVCARQAGYEVMEINASDDRSRDVVRNRIRTSLGTESVKNISNSKDGSGPRKVAKPVCVVVDEVDGVVSGSGGAGEGGFVKALIDLINLDQRNSATSGSSGAGRRKKKDDDFRLMRPIILICNDVYHPSLRPLRQSNLAEIIHVGRPTIDAAVGRLKAVFEKEAIPCDKDAARKLCEAAWGMSSGIDAKRGVESTVQGDLRGVMVVGEWVAGRFRSSNPMARGERLTRQWIEKNVLHDLASGAAGARGLGRGNVRDIVTRLFQEGGGFPKQAMDLSGAKNQHEQPKTELGFGEQHKKYAMERLAQMAETSGEISYILNEVFAEYPNREFNDDCYLTKPNQAYDWLHFHDACQARLYASQEWELAPYLCQPVLACHHLFASPKKHVISMGYDKRWGDATADEAAAAPLPFSGPRADFQAHEAERENRAQLQAIQAQLSPTLGRLFRSAEDVATEFLPYLVRLVAPDVKPVTVGGSAGATASVRKDTEKAMVKRASEVLAEVGVALHKGRIEGGGADAFASRAPEYVYRMEP
jgi:chromosome transmission fidelity protein 18